MKRVRSILRSMERQHGQRCTLTSLDHGLHIGASGTRGHLESVGLVCKYHTIGQNSILRHRRCRQNAQQNIDRCLTTTQPLGKAITEQVASTELEFSRQRTRKNGSCMHAIEAHLYARRAASWKCPSATDVRCCPQDNGSLCA